MHVIVLDAIRIFHVELLSCDNRYAYGRIASNEK